MSEFKLKVDGAEYSGQLFTVSVSGIRLGRSSMNDIHTKDERLSRNHCQFMLSATGALTVEDLASSNGTAVNGQLIVGKVELNPGDIIEAGPLNITVIGDDENAAPVAVEPVAPAPVAPAPPPTPVAPPAEPVDLGLETPAETVPESNANKEANKTSSRRNRLLLASVAIVCLAIVGLVVCQLPTGEIEPEIDTAIHEPRLLAFDYEKVRADNENIYRYALSLTRDDKLTVTLDHVPTENRHIVKSVKLSAEAKARLTEILAESEIVRLPEDTIGPEPTVPALDSLELRTVYDDCVRTYRCVNAAEPEAIGALRGKLEAFTKNELGVWSLGRTRAELIKMAANSVTVGQAKWNDREVEYGNVHAAVSHYAEAVFYLETLEPKPAEYAEYVRQLKTMTAELDKRLQEQRFQADRAINLGNWATAKAELSVLCEMMPDRGDARFREAAEKLSDVEKRLAKEGGR